MAKNIGTCRFEPVNMDRVIKVDWKATSCSNVTGLEQEEEAEYIDVDEDLDSDETVMDGQKITKSMEVGNEKTIVHDDDEDDDQVNDDDDEDGKGEETDEDLIQEPQGLEEESEPVAQKNLPSTDPADVSFVDQGDFNQSTSRLYTWNFLDGPGRVDSDVDSYWVHNEIEVGGDLMACRNRIVENNGGLTEPYEKLAINFVFLVEAEYQTGGLQGEIEDQIWDSLCDAIRDPVPSLSDEAAIEALRWAHRLAQNKSEEFAQLLDDSPPQNRTLKSIMTKMSDTAQLWNTQRRNEDTYLKSQLGPFLDTYFGKLRHTKSDWTPTQDDTRGSESNLLISDYATTTQVGKQQIAIVLLEGKIAKNSGLCQIWDDLTKLGMEMKAALDSILKLQPKDEVCVIGVLVREFYSMRIHAEATYIMHRFAATYIASEAMNVFPLVHLMEVFEHAKAKVEQTVDQLRR
ncbi:hypothetical protein BGZ82_000635, partial [Podila clonocystis]